MKCNICKVELDTSPLTKDCGGDCLRCMAECGDPDTIPTLLAYCRELEAALVIADKAHADQGTKLATLKAAVLADPIKTPAYRRRIALLEQALDWAVKAWNPTDFGWFKAPPHLAAILDASRKRNMGSAGTGTGSDKT